MKKGRVIALILGGGQGTRLFPLTMYRSKPAVPIGGKYRLMDIPISNCLRSGVKNIYVLTQFNSESLNNHINTTYRFDYFSRAFVRILAAEQTYESKNWYQGTADSVKKSICHIDLTNDDEVLILSGDHFYEMDYMEFINFHRSKRSDFTVSTIPVAHGEAKNFGILQTGPGGKIRNFKEKPKRREELEGFEYSRGKCLASMGVYVFNAKVLKKALESSDIDFGKEVIPHSIRHFNGYSHVFNGYWRDIGSIKSFYDVNIELTRNRPYLSFFYEGGIFTRPRFLPPASLVACKIVHSLITDGCFIGSSSMITNSIVGLRTHIGKMCAIKDTVIMGADYYQPKDDRGLIKIGIGDNCHIEKAIVDKNARIGNNVIVKNLKKLKEFDGKDYYIRDGIVIITKNAIIRNGTRI